MSDLLAGREAPLDIDTAINITIQVSHALQHAHAQYIVHRDVKPSNILLRGDGQVLLSDFGIAKALSSSDTHLTASGISLGTPDYLSPELGQGETVDSRSDIFSLGIVLYEMLTLRKPFTGDSPFAVVAAIIFEPLTPPRTHNPEIPSALEKVVLQALEKDPTDRFESASIFASTLERIAEGISPDESWEDW